MKRVCEVLGVARSNMAVRLARSADWRDGRTARPTQDAELIEEIQAHIGQLPSYGYRRVWALVRRGREQRQEPPVNAKRVYRVICATTVYCWSAAGGPKCPHDATMDRLPSCAATSAGALTGSSSAAMMAALCG